MKPKAKPVDWALRRYIAILIAVHLVVLVVLIQRGPTRQLAAYQAEAGEQRAEILRITSANRAAVVAIQASLTETLALLTSSQLETNSKRLVRIEDCACHDPVPPPRQAPVPR